MLHNIVFEILVTAYLASINSHVHFYFIKLFHDSIILDGLCGVAV